MGSDSGYYKEIIDKLERFVKKEYALLASVGIGVTLLACTLFFTLLVLLETAAHFTSTVRTALFFAFFTAFMVLLIVRFVIPYLKYLNLLRKTDYLSTAAAVGRSFPGINDDLLNAMQLVTKEQAGLRYSSSLIDAAFFNVYTRIKNIDFASIVSFKKAKDIFLYFAGAAFFSIILIFFVPGLRAASYRLVNFNREFIPPPKFVFEVRPGNSSVTKGENISVSVKVTGKLPKEVFLAVKSSDQTNFEMQQLYPDSSSLNNSTAALYHFLMPAVRNSFDYYASAENIKSSVYKIEVIDRPVIKTFNITVTSPSYSKIPPVQQKDDGNVTALLGSVVEVNLASTKKLKSARIEFSDTAKKELAVNGSEAAGKFTVRKDVEYRIILTDENNNQNLSPINYSVKARYDGYPTIDVIAPNRDVSLSNDNRLPLDVKISDDFGFTKLLLHYKLTSSKYAQAQSNYKSLEIPINRNMTEEQADYIWNLTELGLSSDDVVTYYFEVFDNDYVSGPKSAKSSTYNIRVPSLSELLSGANDVQNQSEKELQDTYKQAQELKQKFEDISRELKQDKKNISWQEKQKIEQAAGDFKKMQDKLDNIGKKLEKMQNDLQQNNLLSKETMQKYMELQKLFDEMNNDEMKKAMEQLNNVLQNMDRKLTQQSIENMQANEEQIKQTIERTMNLLKRVQVEQKIDELLKRTERITKEQDDIQNKTGKTNPTDKNSKDELSKKQDSITEDLKDYSKQLNDLSKKLSELKDLPKDQLEKAKQQFQDQKNDKLSDQASNNIENNRMQMAQQQQQQVSQNMGKMKQQMQQVQKSMAQQNQMQAFKEMMKMTDNLLTLSKQQEELKNKSKDLNQSSNSLDENARRQDDIRRNLDKITQQMSSLSQKSFAITPEMGKSLGDAKNRMNKAMESLQDRNGSMASINQGNAMESLNEAADMMKSSMEQMMKNGGQGSSGMSLMQQLQQMAGQQMGLNNLTQQLQQAMNGQMSMQQRAELQKLAQQQDLIRKSLEQLNKEAARSGESKKIPADLNDIAKKMEEVVKNMGTDHVDDKTVQQQEHILSKLLDAQRSVNKRDYKDNRESQSGKNISRQSPADLNLSSREAKNKVRDELNKAVQEGYSKDYEELIRKYYDALQKENIKN